MPIYINNSRDNISPVFTAKHIYLFLLHLFSKSSIAFKAVERLHEDQWQISCHQMLGKFNKYALSCGQVQIEKILMCPNTIYLIRRPIISEPRHKISNNVVCATSKGSDQPAHTRSLIRAFASRLNIL